jgi:hypothetical protein
MLKVVELGPFGCRIKRGKIHELDDVPKGYIVKKIERRKYSVTIYIEPNS